MHEMFNFVTYEVPQWIYCTPLTFSKYNTVARLLRFLFVMTMDIAIDKFTEIAHG